jgi:hypothetical protein
MGLLRGKQVYFMNSSIEMEMRLQRLSRSTSYRLQFDDLVVSFPSFFNYLCFGCLVDARSINPLSIQHPDTRVTLTEIARQMFSISVIL